MVDVGVGPLGRTELAEARGGVGLALAGAGPWLGLVVLSGHLGLPPHQGGTLLGRDEGGAPLTSSEVPLVCGDVAVWGHSGLVSLKSQVQVLTILQVSQP